MTKRTTIRVEWWLRPRQVAAISLWCLVLVGGGWILPSHSRTTTTHEEDRAVPALIDWLRSKKGIFHPGLDVVRSSSSSSSASSSSSSPASLSLSSFPTPVWQLTAHRDIAQDEVLLELPRTVRIRSGPVRVNDTVILVKPASSSSSSRRQKEVDEEEHDDDDEEEEEDIQRAPRFIVTAVHPYNKGHHLDHEPTGDHEDASPRDSLLLLDDVTGRYDLVSLDGHVKHKNVERRAFRYPGLDCGTVRRLAEELKKYNASTTTTTSSSSSSSMAPYLDYLLDESSYHSHQPRPVRFWSKAGQVMLYAGILGQKSTSDAGHMGPQSGLPPYRIVTEQQTLPHGPHRQDYHVHDPHDHELARKREEWKNQCRHGQVDDEEEEEEENEAYALWALELMQLRGWEATDMIPFFDFLEHRNEPWQNAEYRTSTKQVSTDRTTTTTTTTTTTDNDEDVWQVYATRDIAAGEPIRISLNLCQHECAHRSMLYGTPQLLRDYGFVEGYPQKWVFPQRQVDFEVIEEEEEGEEEEEEEEEQYANIEKDGSITVSTSKKPKQLKVEWIDPTLSIDEDGDLQWLQQHLKRLRTLPATLLAHRDPDVPPSEWEVIVHYYDSLVTALSLALADAGGGEGVGIPHVVAPDGGESTVDSARGSSCLWNEKENSSCEARTATTNTVSTTTTVSHRATNALLPVYDPLIEKEEVWNHNRPDTCDWTVNSNINSWELLERKVSHYQAMEFHYNPMLKDICFDLDNTVQQCTSYRPHYHETMVHQTAQYVESVKRVAFVGGGDSMLLQDILKYDTLELVVGLELDQQVTRNAFKYFATQPHWDNEKVEWWYGDATKSLLMLPKEYFGSFDMVLVDLSETVMALTVTDDIDVLEALMLLSKPEGIVVKNEYGYFAELSQLFEYTAHLYYSNVPFVCSQDLILGSNKVDFLRSKTYDHDVPHLYEKVDKEKGGNKIVRDFQRNVTHSQKYCQKEGRKEVEPTTQERSPGILMIVEAEQASIKFESIEAVQQTLTEAIQKEGLTILSQVTSPPDQQPLEAALVLQEGYVVARYWPERSYFAFDIHLWSRFDKHKAIEKSLVSAVGSDLSSSYRIVAGGMFGVSTWVEDEKNRGPRWTGECETSPESVRDQPIDASLALHALEGSTGLIKEIDNVVAVLCGREGQPCPSISMLERVPEIKTVLPIWSCSNLKGDDDAADALFACEQETLDAIKRTAFEKNPIRAIFVDSSATRALAQVVRNIFNHPLNVLRLLGDKVTVSAVVVDGKDDWRKAFVHRFREEIVPEEPAFSGEIVFNSSRSSFELSVMSSGDELFVDRLVDVAESVENETGLIADIRNVRGGLFSYERVLELNNSFTAHDYEQKSPLEQWFDQEPLGLQTVLQLEANKHAGTALSSDRIKAALESSLMTASNFDGSKSNLVVHEVSDVGEGSIFTILWDGGSLIALWDGRKHVDINVFTFKESWKLSNIILDKFLQRVQGLGIVLRDEQPRGVGRVVNFRSDIEPRKEPFWTTDFEKYNSQVKM